MDILLRWFGVGALAVLGAMGWMAGCSGNSSSTGGAGDPPPANVSVCSPEALFTTSPITVADLNTTYGIKPLGNVNPPDHTFPAAHLYFYAKDSNPDQAGSDSVPVHAPSSIVVTRLYSSTLQSTGKTDYSMVFYPCDQVQGYFNHMASFTGKLAAAYEAADTECSSYNPGSGTFIRCEKKVNVTVASGEVIGTAGGATSNSTAVDFGFYDSRATKLLFANDARVVSKSTGLDSFHIVCAIDYYGAEVKAALEAKLNRVAGALPLCGTYNQDLAATAQGKWFTSDAPSPATTESGYLSLVHDNTNPALGVFSVGNTDLGVGIFSFTPKNSGTVNRDFKDVTSNGVLHCYDSLSTAGIIFLVRMPTATSLKIEKQSAAACPTLPAFTAAAMTFVR